MLGAYFLNTLKAEGFISENEVWNYDCWIDTRGKTLYMIGWVKKAKDSKTVSYFNLKLIPDGKPKRGFPRVRKVKETT